MIEIKNLVKKYGDHLAVDHVDMTFESGKIYGLLGPNGAGKSSIMNMVTGYLGTTEGEIKINGFDILDEPEKAKACIGYLPEIPPLYMDMTVSEQMDFAAGLKKLPKAEKKQLIEEAMELTGIADMGGRLIKNLSKGYRQRVGFAQAILGYPKVIILDEPTVGLDPKQIMDIRDLIRKLGENHTVILSSHILQEVSAVCDYIYIISKGNIVAADTPENLEHQVMGGQQLHLLIKAEEEEARALLDTIEEIESYEIAGGDNTELQQVSIIAKPEQDIRETIFFAMADAKCPILSMTSMEKTLEDVFLELTKNEKEEA